MTPYRTDVCGSGTYLFALGAKSMGRETFTVLCNADGKISASGRTELQLGGATGDVATSLELSHEMIPTRVTVKGTVAGTSLDEMLVIGDSTATFTSRGRAQEVSFPKNGSWLGGNIYYSLAFILARYDAVRGGEQKFPAFPVGEVTLNYNGRDLVNAVAFDRYVLGVAGSSVAIWVDPDGRMAAVGIPIAGFSATLEKYSPIAADLLKSRTPATSVTASDYSAPPDALYTAEEVSIPVANYVLSGTLVVPKTGKRPFPSALLISGSGLQDRDSRLPIAGLEDYRPFRQIADRLAREGIAVLRVDDRGGGKSTGLETLGNVTTSNLANDVRAEVGYLRTRNELDAARITLIGHSEGASIAPMVASSDPRIAGIVLMAGIAKSGAEVSIEQQNDLLLRDTTRTDAEKEALRVQQRETVRTILAGGEIPGVPVNAWTREYFAYDPLVTIRKVRQPILILQGELDRQVAVDHARLLADAARATGNQDVIVKVFPMLNHLFLKARTGAFAEYSSLESKTIGDDVLDVLALWARSH